MDAYEVIYEQCKIKECKKHHGFDVELNQKGWKTITALNSNRKFLGKLGPGKGRVSKAGSWV